MLPNIYKSANTVCRGHFLLVSNGKVNYSAKHRILRFIKYLL